MTLTRWDPFRELEDVHSRLSRVFGRSPLQRAGNEELTFPDWQPSVDIKETPEAFVIKAELPDVKKEDIRVTVDKQVLTLRGERKSEKEEKDTKVHRIERSYGSFMRSFVLPDNVNPEAIRAESKDGLLTINLAKTAAKAPKSVEVKVG